MNAKKLPSGNWRVRVYVNGKSHSFTAPTKREAEKMAANFKGESATGLSVAEAIGQYIDAKRAVLSPSTIYGYESLQRNAFEPIGYRILDTLTAPEVQRWVSWYAADHSPKRVRNAYALFTSTLKMFRPEFAPQVTLPARKKPVSNTPTTDQLMELLQDLLYCSRDTYVAVLLGAFGPLRRGEICGLTGKDIDYETGTITIRNNKVEGPDGFIVKQPKTAAGYRTVTLPAVVIDKLPLVSADEPLIKILPSSISYRFKAAAKRHGMDVHFHSLRHYGASILHAWGVPDQYIMARGGWESDHVMKRVYREALDDQKKKIQDDVFEKIRDVFV